MNQVKVKQFLLPSDGQTLVIDNKDSLAKVKASLISDGNFLDSFLITNSLEQNYVMLCILFALFFFFNYASACWQQSENAPDLNFTQMVTFLISTIWKLKYWL